MSFSVTMPRLGESVTEGTVTRWLKNEGDRVEADEPLLEVSTDKVDTEIPAPASGVLTSIKVHEDETVDVGVELAVIGDAAGGGSTEAAAAAPAPEATPAEAPVAPPAPPAAPPAPAATVAPSVPAPAAPAAPAATAPAPVVTAPVATAVATAPAPASNGAAGANGTSGDDADDEVAGTYLTPLVRKLAAEHGVDLSTIQGTGLGGRIRKSDILAGAAQASARAASEAAAPAAAVAPAAVAAPAAAPAGTSSAPPAADHLRGRVEKMSRMRQVIAARMIESLQTSAQLTTVVEVDVTKIARLRDQAKRDFEEREGVKLTFLPFFALASVEALKAHPIVNASVDVEQKTITYHDSEHLAIAVDTERGLAVPVIHNAGDLNLAGIARKIADLAERTRANKVSPDELGGGTFTVTNTGSRGALFDTPIINQPQVAILGTGTVVKRAVVLNDANLGETIAIRSMIYLALSYDHRIVDGADAARFLGTVKQRLEAGDFEHELGLS
jgi:pyruvate dehydrogenase E2 component (dihydrolipoamide acetyltransferase)